MTPKLRNYYVTEEELNNLIEKYEFFSEFSHKKLTAILVLNSLLELKQRRAEAKAVLNTQVGEY